MKTTLPLLVFLAGTAGLAEAQNSDLGLLLGVSVIRVSADGRSANTDIGGGAQINYAFQLKETVAGRLYVELPLTFTGEVRTTAASGRTSASVGATIFFIPGVRWSFHPAHRISLYAAAGGGLASFDGVVATSFGGSGTGRAQVGRSTTGAFGFGLGVDFRLTRLVSLRGEYRDAITRGSLDGAVHHSLVMFGVGLHF